MLHRIMLILLSSWIAALMHNDSPLGAFVLLCFNAPLHVCRGARPLHAKPTVKPQTQAVLSRSQCPVTPQSHKFTPWLQLPIPPNHPAHTEKKHKAVALCPSQISRKWIRIHHRWVLESEKKPRKFSKSMDICVIWDVLLSLNTVCMRVMGIWNGLYNRKRHILSVNTSA